jgi:hypothetical protein
VNYIGRNLDAIALRRLSLPPMKIALAFFTSLIERHPGFGYIGAGVPVAAGFWTFLEGLTKIGAFLSIVVGLLAGLTTWQVQRLNKRKVLVEIEKARAETAALKAQAPPP